MTVPALALPRIITQKGSCQYCVHSTVLKRKDWPYPAYGEIVQLDMLNDFIQQPVCHGVEICKRVGLQGNSNTKAQPSALYKLPQSNYKDTEWNCTCYQFVPVTLNYKYLVPLRHEEVEPGSWQPQLNKSLHQPKVCTVSWKQKGYYKHTFCHSSYEECPLII